MVIEMMNNNGLQNNGDDNVDNNDPSLQWDISFWNLYQFIFAFIIYCLFGLYVWYYQNAILNICKNENNVKNDEDHLNDTGIGNDGKNVSVDCNIDHRKNDNDDKDNGDNSNNDNIVDNKHPLFSTNQHRNDSFNINGHCRKRNNSAGECKLFIIKKE